MTREIQSVMNLRRSQTSCDSCKSLKASNFNIDPKIFKNCSRQLKAIIVHCRRNQFFKTCYRVARDFCRAKIMFWLQKKSMITINSISSATTARKRRTITSKVLQGANQPSPDMRSARMVSDVTRPQCLSIRKKSTAMTRSMRRKLASLSRTSNRICLFQARTRADETSIISRQIALLTANSTHEV